MASTPYRFSDRLVPINLHPPFLEQSKEGRKVARQNHACPTTIRRREIKYNGPFRMISDERNK